ncbi:MAG: cytochrome c biogenesis protein CcdA [Candidatus Poribacteria bacterium]|nr:cytochrome c biogenesis protein CcdA [Candidatus Poribacteria bacterium]MDP6999816.1 cytochrome c biogenesis protein CcdA [Candidatus Poribacteria bacterium]
MLPVCSIRLRHAFTIYSLVLFWITSLGIAQFFGTPPEIVRATTVTSQNQYRPGDNFQIAVQLKIQEGWHTNANPAGEDFLIPTELILPDLPALNFDQIVYPAGEITELASVGSVPLYHHQVTIGLEGWVQQTTDPGQIDLPLRLRYQACNDQSCLIPTELNINLSLKIVGTNTSIELINTVIFERIPFTVASVPSEASKLMATNSPNQFSTALSRGYFWAFLFVFVGGILTSLTPCVYPLIPITVSVFGAGKGASRSKSFFLSVTYVLGMAVMYSILGVVVASTGALFGTIMINPVAIGIACTILIALGLSMLGAFEIQLPTVLQNRLNTVGGAGFGGSFLMGTVAGVIAAPCTGPALGAVLSYVATTNNVILGFFLMLTYALGMGLLFILIGTFSGLLSSLPTSGNWMYVLENIFGVAIIGMALFFLKNIWIPLNLILRNSVEFLAIGLLFMVNGVQIGQFTRRFKDLSGLTKVQKAFGVLMAVVGFYIVAGGFINGGFRFVEPAGSGSMESVINWITDESTGFATAKREGKPVMIDCYADWCSVCKELEHRTFSDPEVAKRLSGFFVTIKLDFTNPKDPQIQSLKRKYQIGGLPVVLFFDANGQELKSKRFESFMPASRFLTWIADIQ